MKKEVISCSGGNHIAKKLNLKYNILKINKFPDNELNIRFPVDVKRKEIILVQSFYNDINEKIIEVLFAAHTAKDLGAKKIILIAPYFPYFRKDERFKSGECISIEVMSELFKIFNKIYVVEPHLHRIKDIKKVLKNGERIDVSEEIVDYIKKLKLKNPLIIGPDMESFQWARHIGSLLNVNSIIFKKKRYGSRKVKINLSKKLEIKDKDIVIIDDIISTGHTLLETIKQIKKYKPKKIYCIGIHGIFVENALSKLKKYSEVISTNTIPNKVAKIDISKVIIKKIK